MILLSNASAVHMASAHHARLTEVYGYIMVESEVHSNHKRSLTHHTGSQGWAPECPIHFVGLCFTDVVCWVQVSFLSSLPPQLT